MLSGGMAGDIGVRGGRARDKCAQNRLKCDVGGFSGAGLRFTGIYEEWCPCDAPRARGAGNHP
jgi:hypothetical protein